MDAVVEIAVDSAEDAHVAVAAGADRLEVCASLALHGLTPAPRVVALASGRVPVVALVRPRTGGFIHDAAAWSLVMRQAGELLAAGAEGVAFGCLTAEGAIDSARCTGMVRACGRGASVFHRAFDLAADPGAALEMLVDAGVRRVLTAGMGREETGAVLGLGPAGAVDPLERRLARLRELVERARGRIEIVACGGVRPANGARFVHEAGCGQVHSACRGAGGQRVDAAMVRELKAVVARAAQT